MVLSTSQQVVLAFTAVLFMFVVLPRMFGLSSNGTGSTEARFGPRYSRKGPGPGAVRGQPVSLNAPGSPQSPENVQQMKKLMEQELKSDKYKSNNNKGYVFTLMPLYAIGVGVFAAYKFLKIKSSDDQAQKDKFVKGAKKSVEAENQLNELEQRLAQTEKMLNSILTQLDPLTNCVKSVAKDQKNEIMSQLQTIRYLMKKRGMDCPPLNIHDASCEGNLDDLIESLGVKDTPKAGPPPVDQQVCEEPVEASEHVEAKGEDAAGQEMMEVTPEKTDRQTQDEGNMEDEEGLADAELIPSLEDCEDVNIEEIEAEQRAPGLRRRNRLE
ncbi:coiled-coil domain-containing protein 107 [Thalassophryne amazonica]|uniref:coiled-coil domain-containing protein 107 n=1 Tax=Thalassophryne amazonica TaxID=390379 RepID=UPI001471D2EA|nr:coiled-coil domain-containing protein 107 [Thalassophryne amazonica]